MPKTITPVEKLQIAACVTSGMLMMASTGANADTSIVQRAKAITEQLMKAFDIIDEPQEYFINGPNAKGINVSSAPPIP